MKERVTVNVWNAKLENIHHLVEASAPSVPLQKCRDVDRNRVTVSLHYRISKLIKLFSFTDSFSFFFSVLFGCIVTADASAGKPLHIMSLRLLLLPQRCLR